MLQTQNVVVVPSHDGTTYPNYSKKSSLVLGIFHLVIVFVLFIMSIVGVALATAATNRSSLVFPMIGCALYLAAGICAVVAGCNGKRGVVIASTVLNIICAVIAVIYVIIMVIAIAALHALLATTNHSYYIQGNYNSSTTASHAAIKVLLGVFYVIFFVYLAQAVITIWTSAIGCSVTCCGSNNQTQPPVVMTTTSGAPVVVPMHGQQIVQTSYAPPNYDHQAGGYNPGAGMPLKQ
ncbi:hypothetical protein NP493_409g04014 [Ridgeia piscesae]|uniref:Uncharacterized protein n=1 Tax=Ridgeia piscesae TaxID=27915 RepID=A0AAD9NSH6_RIDPI|nr:hypothetical protein NP493_409g04014 [Ridgeia piscesae]